jgi:transposase
VGDGVHRWHLCPGEKGGSDIGPTKRGKGSKCMVLVERQGIPLGITIAAASPAEITLADATLNARVPPRRRKPTHLLGDRAYDSDPLRKRLAARGIVLTSPYRGNNLHRRYQDGRHLRTYRHRWIIERTIAWFGAFRRLVVRYERSTRMFLAFFQFAAALIALRRL